jgi:hypothetical protein
LSFAVFAVSDSHPGIVKIGHSMRPRQRYEKSLGLRILALEPGGEAREYELHGMFARYRLWWDVPAGLPTDGIGEWFTFSREIRFYVAGLEDA